jgi:ATP-binding protein involved in chromosome partitioning
LWFTERNNFMSTPIRPIAVTRHPDCSGVTIQWNNSTSPVVLSAEVLRRNCPCALCREERGDDPHAGIAPKKKSALTVVKHDRKESLTLTKIWGVGNYALGIEWADGHSEGLYPYTLLATLGAPT